MTSVYPSYDSSLLAIAVVLIAAVILVYFGFFWKKYPEKLTYKIALEKANQLEKEIGATQSRVIALLGEPTKKDSSEWYYDFQKLSGYPKDEIKVGQQTFFGVSIAFDDQNHVQSVRFAWVDVTGPG